MRGVLMVVALSLAVAVSAEELTVPEVIAAHRAGAPVEGILRLVREAPEVAVLAAQDLERLRSAGVPEAVIVAMVARHSPPAPPPTATPTESRPDDASLEDVARLVKAGLSERLLCEQIRQSGRRHTPSANDLVFLKEHGVPETVIAALMASGASPTPTPSPLTVARSMATPTPAPTAAPPLALTFEPLVRLAGVFRKAQAGRLVLTAEWMEWGDASDTPRAERIATASLRAVWLATVRRSLGPPLVELRVRTSGGDELTFHDVDWSTGGSGRTEALYQAIRERFPQVVLTEKPGR